MTDKAKIKIANNRLVTTKQPYWCGTAAGALVVSVIWPYVSLAQAALWFAILCTADRQLAYVSYRFWRDECRDERADYWEGRLVTGNLIAGIIWGVSCGLLYMQSPADAAPLIALIAVLVIGGWSIAHIPSDKCILAFSLPATFFLAFSTLVGGNFADIIIGMTATVFMIAVLRHSRIVSIAYRASIEHTSTLEAQALTEVKLKKIMEQDHLRLSTLLDDLPVPIVVSRCEDSTILYINRAATDLSRLIFTQEDGQKSTDFLVNPEEWATVLKHAGDKNHNEYSEIEIRRSDGTTFWSHYAANRTNYQGENAVIISYWDISGQKETEEARRTSEENLRKTIELQNARLRNLLDSVPAPVIVARTKGGEILYANELAKERLKLVDSNIRYTTDLFADAADRVRLLKQVTSTGNISNFEVQFKRGDGSTFWALYSGNKMSYDGESAVIGTFIDITERREAEEARRQSEEKFRMLADNANDWINVFSLDGICLYTSPSVERLLGFTPDEIIGTSLLNYVSHEDYAAIVSANSIRGKSGNEFPKHLSRVRRKDGQMEWMESMSSIQYNPITGRATHVSSVTRLVTERIIYEQQLKDARTRAEAADRAKSDFLAHMSHEIRTPLNAVIGFSEVMRDQLFGPLGSPRYLEYINDIHNSGVHLLELINDVLDLSKIEAGKLELQEDRVSLMAIIDTAFRFMNERAHAKHILLQSRLDIAPDIWCDKRVITQVLLNLISNAVKFTPERGKVTLESHMDDAGNLQLMVTDTGIGIAEDDIPVVMQPFGQARTSSNLASPEAGTGLGLPLSRSFMEKHGGTLTLASEVGIGTRVTITIPASRVMEDKIDRKRFSSAI